MTRLMEGIGLILTLTGGAAADSDGLLVPVVMIGAGMVLMALGKLEERRMW
ncbi:MAG: hypothetical protein IKG25_05705 [Mogibacterium sp.]|nr:hypothetical protein [Mogibacterium sp.]MBR4090389.1 hypothetical protein [Mogibacterium sp.]